MPRRPAVLATPCVALAAAAGALVSGAPAVPAGSSGITGRARLDDRPAAGVTVAAVAHETAYERALREARHLPPPQPLVSTTTAADGSFRLALPQAAVVDLVLRGSGAVPARVAGPYAAGDATDVGELTLAAAMPLSGRVVDLEGRPVAGAQVELRASDEPRWTITGADGAFRFEEARRDGNRLSVEAYGWAPRLVSRSRAGALPRPIVLERGTSLAGRVRGGSPEKPPLVRVEGVAGTTRWVEAASDGRFRVSDAPQGLVTLVAEGDAAGFGEKRGVTLPLPEGHSLELALAPTATLEGRVVDARTRRPLADVRLTATSEARTLVARSGVDGRYRLTGLAGGSYQISVDAARYALLREFQVRVEAGATRVEDFALKAAARLTGRVVDESGRPVADAVGHLLPARGNRGFFDTESLGDPFRTGADGRFAAERLAPGEGQRLVVAHPDFERQVVGGIDLAPSGVREGLVVTLRAGLTLPGLVKDTEGKPVAEAEVTLRRSRTLTRNRGGAMLMMISEADMLLGASPKAKSGTDGRFTLRGLSEGDYALRVEKSGYAAHDEPLKVGAETEALEIALGPGAALRGVVRRPDGRPATAAFVRAQPQGAPRQPGMRGLGGPVDADGSFAIEDVKRGELYEVVAMGSFGPAARLEGVAAPAEDLELVVSGAGAISGRVIDAEEHPVTAFEASFSPASEGGFRFRFAGPRGGAARPGEPTPFQDETGAFLFEEVPAGTWEVSVRASGYPEARVGGIAVQDGATVPVEVRLARGVRLAGRVVEAATGTPIPGASVEATPAQGDGRRFDRESETIRTSDADGAFRFDGLAAGSYRVTASSPESAPVTEVVDLARDVDDLTLRLGSGATLAGVVLSETRVPLTGAEVGVAAAGDRGLFGGMGPSAVTDASGRFRLRHLTPGRYTLTAALRERTSNPLEVVVQGDETREDLVLTLAGGATVRGRVSGLSESERASVRVWASGPEGFSSSTLTGSDGGFEMAGVPAGAVTFRASAGDVMRGATRSASAQVELAEGQAEASVEIVFEAGLSLSGEVTRGGEPVADAYVNAFQRAAGRSGSGRSDASGRYRIEGLAPGSYSVSAWLPGGSQAPEQTLSLEADATLDIEFPSGRIAGTVLAASTKAPLADASIEVERLAEPGSPRRFLSELRSDSNGRFLAEDLSHEPYRLTVRKPGYEFDQRQVTPGAAGSETLVVELQPGEGFAFVARDGLAGVPLRGLYARVDDAAGATVFSDTVALDSEGRGEIPSLKPGSYRAWLNASGYAPVALSAIGVPGPALTLAFTPGGTLEIRVGPETLARGPVECRILDAGGAVYLPWLFSHDGRLPLSAPVRRLEHVTPGRYTLAVDGGPTPPFEVIEGRTVVVELP